MKGWDEIYTPILKEEKMVTLRKRVKEDRAKRPVLPKSEEVLNAFKLCPYEKLKVVIIGQDPYQNAIDAHGLAFSSRAEKRPASLNNIFKEIKEQLYPGQENCFSTNNLTSWAEQGVLLLNRVLTVVEGVSDSHKDLGWEYFTTKIIEELSRNYPRRLIFVLWGNNAKELQHSIDDRKHYVLSGTHPSPLSANKGFFGNGHFTTIQSYLGKIYFESLKKIITEEYDWKELSNYIKTWLSINNINITEDDMTKTLKFVNGNIGEILAMNDHNIKKLYEINFKT